MDLLSIWQQRKAEKIKRERSECPTVKMEWGSVPAEARRMPIVAWVRAGQLPAFLTLAFVESLEKGKPVAVPNASTPE